jgi:hypothetical protein
MATPGTSPARHFGLPLDIRRTRLSPRIGVTNAALPVDRGVALRPAGIAAIDEAAVRPGGRSAPAGLRAAWCGNERGNDGDAERKPGSHCTFARRHPMGVHRSVGPKRPLRHGNRHGVVMRLGQGRDGRVKPLDEVFVRILGARGRKRNQRDRENKSSFAEHSFLPCFWRGDTALTGIKDPAMGDEFLPLRSMCSHMRDGEICVRVCSTGLRMHPKA